MALQVWLPLTKDARNQGLCSGTVTTSGVTFADGGKLGGKYFSGGIITIPATMSKKFFNKTGMSFAFWLYPVGTSGTGIIMGQNAMTAGDNRMYSIFQYPTVNDLHISWQDETSDSTFLTGSWEGFFPADTWTHCCIVYDGNIVIIYRNGEQYITINGVSNRANFEYAYPITGSATKQLQDVRIYNHCLTPEEVKKIAQGLVLHYPLNHEGLGNANLITNSKLDESWTYPSSSYSDKYSPITAIIPSASQYTLSFDAKSTVNGDKIRTHYYSPNTTTTCVSNQGTTKTAADGNMDFTLTTQWQRYWVIYTQTETTAVKHLICPRLVSGQGTGTISVRNVKFEEGAIATPWCPNSSDEGSNATVEYDCSGFCNNGTIYKYDDNGDIITDLNTPKYSVCTHIKAGSPTENSATGLCYIYGNCTLTTPNQLTISFWCKPIHNYQDSTSRQGVFCTTNDSIGINAGTDYSTTAMHHRDGQIDVCQNGGTHDTISTPFVTGEWHHYTFLYNGQNIQWYKDGIFQSEKVFDNADNLKSFSAIVIGFTKAGGVYRKNDCYMSDFRIYATALSAEDIQALYQAKNIPD